VMNFRISFLNNHNYYLSNELQLKYFIFLPNVLSVKTKSQILFELSTTLINWHGGEGV
jgi:hypothetical protein